MSYLIRSTMKLSVNSTDFNTLDYHNSDYKYMYGIIIAIIRIVFLIALILSAIVRRPRQR